MSKSARSHLHDKLARVSASHGGALSGSKDPDGPDVEGYRAKETTQHHPLYSQRETDRYIQKDSPLYGYASYQDVNKCYFMTNLLTDPVISYHRRPCRLLLIH